MQKAKIYLQAKKKNCVHFDVVSYSFMHVGGGEGTDLFIFLLALFFIVRDFWTPAVPEVLLTNLAFVS